MKDLGRVQLYPALPPEPLLSRFSLWANWNKLAGLGGPSCSLTVSVCQGLVQGAAWHLGPSWGQRALHLSLWWRHSPLTAGFTAACFQSSLPTMPQPQNASCWPPSAHSSGWPLSSMSIHWAWTWLPLVLILFPHFLTHSRFLPFTHSCPWPWIALGGLQDLPLALPTVRGWTTKNEHDSPPFSSTSTHKMFLFRAKSPPRSYVARKREVLSHKQCLKSYKDNHITAESNGSEANINFCIEPG